MSFGDIVSTKHLLIQFLDVVAKVLDDAGAPEWFKYKGSFTNGGSFPSGHSASAFAVATVIAEQYRQHRWVPWVCYGTAAFLSLTRLPAQAHFPSDIFIGGVLGYTISHFVVLGR